jgi:hypothetical protein
MSGLGSTVSDTGEPGSVVTATPQLSESLPADNSSIRQTTSINTVEHSLTQNYIHNGTYTISTLMAAGTVFFAIRIHPSTCNWYTNHISKAHNTYTGGFKARTRPIATAWYGGDVRLGFLPPNMTEAEVRAAPLNLLTAHPNQSLDPKNTGWTHWTFQDQRPIAYHYLRAPITDPSSFGGWMVGFVAARLVTQSPEFTTIDFLVETAGDFIFDQITPVLDELETENDPLGAVARIPLNLHPTLDSMASGDFSVVQVLPSSVLVLHSGGLTMSAIGLPLALGKLASLVNKNPNVVAAEQFRMTSSTQSMKVSPDGDNSNWSSTERLPENYDFSNLFLAPIHVKNPATANSFYVKADSIDNSGVTPFLKAIQGNPTGTTVFPNGTVGLFLAADSDVPLRVDTGGNTPLMQLSPMSSGESLVIFGDFRARTFCAQTALMAHALGKYDQNLSTSDTSFIYTLRAAVGTPIMLLRLQPNGLWTARASTTAIVVPSSGCYLDFFTTLPVTSPLPAPTLAMNLAMQDLRAVQHRATKRGTPLAEFLTTSAKVLDAYSS